LPTSISTTITIPDFKSDDSTTADDQLERMTPMMYTLNFFIASKCGYSNPFADEATTLIFDKL
jgi:hypothetical protein